METVSTTNVGFFQLLLLFSYEIFCSKRYTSQHYQFHYHTKNHFFFWCIHVKTLRSPKTNSTLHGNIYNESQSISIKNRILGQRKFPGIRQHWLTQVVSTFYFLTLPICIVMTNDYIVMKWEAVFSLSSER
jgi:hypothetical protein